MLIRFFIYGLLGWAMEIAWTALPKRQPIDWRLPGHTYVWMFPIYGLVAPLYEPLHDALRDAGVHLLLRGAAYALGIMAIETLTGWLLQRLTGKIPWDYRGKTRWQWRGYTRFDYFPLWFLVGLALEPLHDFLVRLTPAIEAALA